MNAAMSASLTHQICTFHLDDLFCGVEVGEVQEVVRRERITMVPLAPPAVVGLINLRGDIVTVLDPRRCLQLSGRTSDCTGVNMVVRNNGTPISLLVDRTGDVVTVDEQCFEPLPETTQHLRRDLVRGTYTLAHRLLLLLDTAAVIRAAAETYDPM